MIHDGYHSVIARLGPGSIFEVRLRPLVSEVETALAALGYADRLVAAGTAEGHTCLNTIELDAEPDRFPDVLVAYFGDSVWDYTERFCIGEVCQERAVDTYRTGRLTFVAHPGLTSRLLSKGQGIRWGAALSVGGVRVRESSVAQVLHCSPFSGSDSDMEVLRTSAEFVWVANRSLYAVSVWVRPGADALLAALQAVLP